MKAGTFPVAGLLIERATERDLDRILRIEQESFSAPWTRKMFEAELTQNPFGRLYVARAAEAPQDLVGYVCFWAVFEELRLMTLAVEPSRRRQGIGRALLHEALALGRAEGATKALLEVRASNTAAVQMYEESGFRRTAVRARYYVNPVEDAVLMERDLSKEGVMLTDERIAEQLRASSLEFRQAEAEHHRLDAELAELHKRHVLTPQEELLVKQMHKEKLAKKDKLAQLIRAYRDQQAHSTAR
jgi:ribosomal-protein-alanine N-acetyltransferase